MTADQETDSFYISRWWDLKLIDKEFNEIDIQVPIECDGIFFKEMDERKLNLEIEEIGADLIKNQDYYVDLDERKIKKRGTTMHKSNGGESAITEVSAINKRKSWLKRLWS